MLNFGRSMIACLISAVSICLLPQVTNAQRVIASGDMLHGSRRADLGTLYGARITRETRSPDPNFILRTGFGFAARGGRSFGSTCVGGPIMPGACPPEDIAERRVLVVGVLGAGVHGRAGMVGSTLYLDALAGAGSIVDRGVQSGMKRRASRPLLGIAGGIEVQLQLPSTRYQILSGFDGAGVNAFTSSCVDCWMPFNGTFGFRRWYAGVAYGNVRPR